MVKRAIVEIDEEKCNGCGECVPKCAEGALRVEEGKARLAGDVYCDGIGACVGVCPQGALKVTEREAAPYSEEAVEEKRARAPRRTRLRNWPVQLNLVNPKAPFFEGADLLVMSDCVPVVSPDWQGTLLKGQVVLVGCPKFDDVPAYLAKLTQIFSDNTLRSITVVNMEVPCCSGLARLVEMALKNAGKTTKVNRLVFSVEGEPL